MIYTAPAVPVVSSMFKISLLLVAIAAVPMGIILCMVVGAAMLPVASRKCCLLVTMVAIPLVIGMTIVWTVFRWVQKSQLFNKAAEKPG